MSDQMTPELLIAIKKNIEERFSAGDRFPRADMLCLVDEVERLITAFKAKENEILETQLYAKEQYEGYESKLAAQAQEIKAVKDLLANPRREQAEA